MGLTPLTRYFSRMGALRFGDLGPLVRAAVGRCPRAAGNCRALCRACRRGSCRPWSGLTYRSSWRPSLPRFEVRVLVGRTLHVPYHGATLGPRPIQVLRSAADNHGQPAPQVSLPVRWQLNRSDLAYNDEITGSAVVDDDEVQSALNPRRPLLRLGADDECGVWAEEPSYPLCNRAVRSWLRPSTAASRACFSDRLGVGRVWPVAR